MRSMYLYKYFVFLTFVFGFFIYEGCSSPRHSRMVGGKPVPRGMAPYHASLQNLTGYHVCGGAIMSERWIISAAHCFLDVNPEYIKVVVGTSDLQKGGLTYDVEAIRIHEHYNITSRENDIALLRMARVMQFGDYVRSVRLETYVTLYAGKELLITGFGANEPHGASSTNLYGLIVNVLDQEICSFAMRNIREVKDTMFCTFTQIGEGTCRGDSGGPIVENDNLLLGIISWGIPCALGFPDVHTRVAVFVPWIRQTIRDYKQHVLQ